MQPTQAQIPAVTQQDWQLIGELLDREVKTLLIEVRHADVRAARATLQRRLEQTQELLAKIGTYKEA